MAEPIRARALMCTDFQRISVDASLGEALEALSQAQLTVGMPNALMVVDADGEFAGMLTAKLLIRALVRPVAPDVVDDARLLHAACERLALPISDAGILDVPVVGPDARLLEIIRRGLATRLDFVPVVEAGEPLGLVPVTAIFAAAASIALTPEDEGIQFDR